MYNYFYKYYIVMLHSFAAGGSRNTRVRRNGPQGTSFAGLRPALGAAGVTIKSSLVGKGGGLNKPIIVIINQLGGVGRMHSQFITGADGVRRLPELP